MYIVAELKIQFRGDNVESKINLKKLIDINSNLNTQIYIYIYIYQCNLEINLNK